MAAAGRLFGELLAAFPRFPASVETQRVYVRELEDVPDDLLAKVVRVAIRTCEHFPTVRALREIAAELTLALPTEIEAMRQIDDRLRWARVDDRPTSPTPVHPAVLETLQLVGGFQALRNAERPGIARAQLAKAWREERARIVQAAVADVDGLNDRSRIPVLG